MSREQWGSGYYKGLKDGLKIRISFYDFVITMHSDENSSYGDFAEDIQRDKSFPKEIPDHINWRTGKKYTSYKLSIWDHLCSLNACYEAKVTFLKLWNEWMNVMA